MGIIERTWKEMMPQTPWEEMNQMSSEAVLKIQGSEGNIVYFRHDLGPVQDSKTNIPK